MRITYCFVSFESDVFHNFAKFFVTLSTEKFSILFLKIEMVR